MKEAFSNELLYDKSISPSQNVTGNNSKYVRKFWELSNNKIGGVDDWIFYCKGGGYRKWWGNLEDVVDWSPSARGIYQYGDGKHASQIINKDYWYRKGITWGLITSALPSFRVMPEGATYDKGGSTIIVDENVYYFTLALLNSKVYLNIASMLNPTLNFQVKDVRSMPLVLKNADSIEKITEDNIAISKRDWDSFETSWNFRKHPLISYAVSNVSSREVIRNYFLTDFIKDHIKTYQKRPIYWLFDSGKQNGFKALVYMHRWNADTIGNVRVEYLHRIQRVYEKEITRMQEIIDNSHDNKEISNATKRKEKLQKQIKETKDYDAKIAHLALSRIDIDLDDGVKVNYEKVQTADGKKMQILAKI